MGIICLGSPLPLPELSPPNFHCDLQLQQFSNSPIRLVLSVGALMGTAINPLQDYYYIRSRKASKDGKLVPEGRLYPSVPGSLFFTAELFWYGWSLYAQVH
jgi:hypothetical protein